MWEKRSRPRASGTAPTSPASAASSRAANTSSSSRPATVPMTSGSNSRPTTDASASSSRQASDWRCRRRPIASITPRGMGSRSGAAPPSDASSLPISTANSGLPWVSAWISAARSAAGASPIVSANRHRGVGAAEARATRATPWRARARRRPGLRPAPGRPRCRGSSRPRAGARRRAAPATKRRSSSEGASAACRSSRPTTSGPAGGGLAQEGRDRLEEPEAVGLGRLVDQVGQLGQERRELGPVAAELVAQRVGVDVAHVGAQRLHPRPVGRRAAGLPAAPDADARPAGPRVVRELVGQAALADPGLAGDEHEPPATGDRVVERAEQHAELALAADEPAGRRGPAPLRARRARRPDAGSPARARAARDWARSRARRRARGARPGRR